MAFSATTVWEVRTTGSDANGGGFNAASSGTDYSQQNAPQFSYTDLVIATTTTLTSVARPFSSVDVGNIINITSGTGFTVQRVQIVSVSGSTATVDKTIGTAASAGGNGNLGGCLATALESSVLAVGGNMVWIKSGTYSAATAVAFSNSVIATNMVIAGYGITRGDDGASPLLVATVGTALELGGGTDASYMVHNLSMLTTVSGTTGEGIRLFGTWTSAICTISKCSISGFQRGITAGGLSGAIAASLLVVDTLVTGCSLNGITTASPTSITNCVLMGNGIQPSGSGASLAQILFDAAPATGISITNTIVANGGGTGIDFGLVQSNGTVQGCTVANNAVNTPSSGISVLSGAMVVIESCIIYGNTTGVNFGSSTPSTFANSPQNRLKSNAYGANGTNVSGGSGVGPGAVLLTANPFTASSTGDFSINSTSGGGLLCTSTGFPGPFPGGLTTGTPNIGAVQASGRGATNGGYSS